MTSFTLTISFQYEHRLPLWLHDCIWCVTDYLLKETNRFKKFPIEYCLQRNTLIARFMGPTWDPSEADKTCWPHGLCYLGVHCLALGFGWNGRHLSISRLQELVTHWDLKGNHIFINKDYLNQRLDGYWFLYKGDLIICLPALAAR